MTDFIQQRRYGVSGALILFLAALGSGCALIPTSDEVVVKRAQMHMGTLVRITAVAPTEHIGQRAITVGFQEIHRLEKLLSTWRPDSELSRVNAAAGERPIKVSPETLYLVKRAVDMNRLTHGSLNIGLGPAIELWSVMEQPRVPTREELERVRPLVDLGQLSIDESVQTLFLRERGMRLDVGGIGKGYTADRAVEVMKRAGATAGVVALSGDIKTFGRLPDDVRFLFGIRHPREVESVLAFIELEDEAISTAGDYERYFELDGVRYHHILDPVTLEPARLCRSVTVIGREGTLVDGLDTGIFVMGPQRGMELVERLPDVEAVIVDGEGQVLISSGLRQRIKMVEPGHDPIQFNNGVKDAASYGRDRQTSIQNFHQ